VPAHLALLCVSACGTQHQPDRCHDNKGQRTTDHARHEVRCAARHQTGLKQPSCRLMTWDRLKKTTNSIRNCPKMQTPEWMRAGKAQCQESQEDESKDLQRSRAPRFAQRYSCAAARDCQVLSRQDSVDKAAGARRERRRWDTSKAMSGCPSSLAWVPLTVLYLALLPSDSRHANAQEQVRRADYATNCGLGFAGLLCSEVMTCEELDHCSGHGLCQRGGFCICDPGWEGPTCKQSNCPSECSGHGTCAITGGCVCDAGYTGVVCNQVICLGGGNCTGHGACLPGGICECEKGYLGGACDIIDVAQKCSNHGTMPCCMQLRLHASNCLVLSAS